MFLSASGSRTAEREGKGIDKLSRSVREQAEVWQSRRRECEAAFATLLDEECVHQRNEQSWAGSGAVSWRWCLKRESAERRVWLPLRVRNDLLFAINLRNAIEETHYDGHCHGLTLFTSLLARTENPVVERQVDSVQQSRSNTSRLPTSNWAATWTMVSVAQ